MSVRAQVSSSRYSTCLYLQQKNRQCLFYFEIGCKRDRLSLATIRAQPGGLPGERAVVGATHSSWFSFGLRSLLPPETSCCPPTLWYYPRALGLISFVETRQSAFIFQA